jgi:hypothetical protein
MSDETYEQRLAAVHRREILEAESPRARQQRLIDYWWEQQKIINDVDDGYVMIGGFRELRRPSCHRGRHDSDW